LAASRPLPYGRQRGNPQSSDLFCFAINVLLTRHCEERSDEAIQNGSWIASLHSQ
jgi:hypothetical protein